jgi:hypothetical protein
MMVMVCADGDVHCAEGAFASLFTTTATSDKAVFSKVRY